MQRGYGIDLHQYGYQTFLRTFRFNARQRAFVHCAYQFAMAGRNENSEFEARTVYLCAVNILRRMVRGWAAVPVFEGEDCGEIQAAINRLRAHPKEGIEFAEYLLWASDKRKDAVDYLVSMIPGVDVTF